MGAKITGAKELAEDLHDAAENAVDATRSVVSKGCLNIKKDIRRQWTGFKHAPDLPKAVTYDTDVKGTLVTGEVGPDKSRRQGALGNLLEGGSPTSAPHPAVMPAADREEPRFYKALEDLEIDLLEGRVSKSSILTYDEDSG